LIRLIVGSSKWRRVRVASCAPLARAMPATRNMRHFDDTTISLINPFGG